MNKGLVKTCYRGGLCAWPHIKLGIITVWVIIIVPICSVSFDIICLFLSDADKDGGSNYGPHYNLFTGDYDANQRTDGSYLSDSRYDKGHRH